MRKSVFVLAVIGAACSSVAFAAEVKKDKAHIPAVKATTMSDADMDKVTAGDASKINFLFNGGNDHFVRINNNNINCHNTSPCP
jgi:hypothetical protein